MLSAIFSFLYYIFSFVVAIGILIFIHELGHFIAAKLCGVGVQVFSLGFGPKIIRRTHGGTEYCISAIPLGGYVKMVGEEPGSTVEKEDEAYSFTHKSLFKKSIIVAAGPFFNFFLTIFIYYILFQVAGFYYLKPVVGSVEDKSPAMMAGIQPGDKIVEINKIEINSFEDIAKVIGNSSGEELNIIIERNGDFTGYTILPKLGSSKNEFNEDIEKYLIGISPQKEVGHKKLNPLEALSLAFKGSFDAIKMTVLAIVKMINGSISAKNMGGPIMIAQMAGDQAKAGLVNFFWFIALLSVNLAIINLLPIPVLDGGHLLFFFIEAVTGSAVSDKLREKLVQFGVAVLVALMVFVFYNDIVRIINKMTINGG
ncbi:MAG: RIP metalloprotease RseP [Desulfobacteraceae bacterium]|nr:RIP metalloprotease RseP [Desulfobacteraceae bacterium]